MEERFFVADRGGLIGSMTVAEIRNGLDAGTLKPTFVCLPGEPAGDPSRRWQPLWVVFNLPKPEDAAEELPSTSEVDVTQGQRKARTVEERLAALEQRPFARHRSGVSGEGLGGCLLTFGQLVSVLACIGSLLYALVSLSAVALARKQMQNAPDPSLWIVLGAVVAFLYSAAMFVVFCRAKQVPPE